MSTKKEDHFDEARALYEEALAMFEAAKAEFEALEAVILRSLSEGKELRAAYLAQEELARSRLFVARVRLSRRTPPGP